MIIRQNKITALGMLLLIALPLIFSVGIMVKQKAIQWQRKERFETENIETIIITAEKLHWINPGKEAIVEGRLFDVESFRPAGKNISLTGFFDGKEDELVKQIKDLTEQKKDNDNPLTRFAVKLLFIPVYTEPASTSFQQCWHTVGRDFYSYSELILPGFHPLDIPPPKQC
jgi:hypothetical protein